MTPEQLQEHVSAGVTQALEAFQEKNATAIKDEVAAGLARVDRRIDGCLARAAIVRFDAYQSAGGHQSTALALLDGSRSGVVISAIQGRDHARIYVKDIQRGRSSVALSPEEQEAVERAMASS